MRENRFSFSTTIPALAPLFFAHCDLEGEPSMRYETRYCTHCGTPLMLLAAAEDDGNHKERLRCPACGWTRFGTTPRPCSPR